MSEDWRFQSFHDLSGADVYAVLALRSAVFVVEQNCVFLDPDGADQAALHWLAWSAAGRLDGYLRLLLPDADRAGPQIGRVVTDPAVRGTGLGRRLMQAAINQTHQLWPQQTIELSAQLRLEKFYASLGFRRQGTRYLEDGIPHIKMCFASPEP